MFSRVSVEGGNVILDAWDAISPPDESAYDDDDDDDDDDDNDNDEDDDDDEWKIWIKWMIVVGSN